MFSDDWKGNGSWLIRLILSVRGQKGEPQNRCFKKTNYAKFSEKRTYLSPWHVRVRIRGQDMSVFPKIWLVLFFWNTRFEIRPFALLPMILEKQFGDDPLQNSIHIHHNWHYKTRISHIGHVYMIPEVNSNRFEISNRFEKLFIYMQFTWRFLRQLSATFQIISRLYCTCENDIF